MNFEPIQSEHPATELYPDDEMSIRARLLADLLVPATFTPTTQADTQVEEGRIESRSDRSDVFWAIMILCFFGVMLYLNSTFGRFLDPRILTIALAAVLLIGGLLIAPNRTGAIFLQTAKIVLGLIMIYIIFAITMFIALLLICSQML